MLGNSRIAFIGGGAMGEAIIKGLLAEGVTERENLIASDPAPERRQQIETQYGVSTTDDNVEAVKGADIVVFCVKPQVSDGVMAGLKGHVQPGSLVLSIMAGVPISAIRSGLDHDCIVRSMPNTPAQISVGATVWTDTPQVTDEQREQVAQVLNALGVHIAVHDERYLDMATGLSGSGPGFVFLIIEAMIDAGVHIGFSRPDAEKLVLQTIEGSVALMRDTGLHPADLRNRVTSPAGTTAAGLFELEAGGMRAVLLRAVNAAYQRSVQLGAKYDEE